MRFALLSRKTTQTIIVDLDGTLLDSSKRLYRLFCRLAPGCDLSKDDYWTAKRLPTSNETLLLRGSLIQKDQIEQFRVSWLDQIEDPELLALDELHPNVLEGLQMLAAKYRLVLLTARQSAVNAAQQLQDLQIATYFSRVMVTGGKRSKLETLQDAGETYSADDYMIGDTSEDISTGRALGIRAAVVENGFRCAEYLRRHGPDEIHNDFFQFARTHA